MSIAEEASDDVRDISAGEVQQSAADLQSEVEADRIRGVQNVTKVSALVSNQQAVYNRLHAKVFETEESGEAAQQQGAYPASSRLQSRCEYAYEEVRQLNKKGLFNPSRMYNACDVANKRATEKARQDRFQRRRRQCMDEELKRNEDVRQAHEAIDRCVAKRQEELVEKQAAMAVVAQHKRNEQHKILHEVEKHQDREIEKMREKSDLKTFQATHEKGKASEDTSKVSESLLRGNQVKVSPGVAADPFYREILASHNLYDSTLSRWTSFVKDNEKRAEAYRVKVMQDDGKKRSTSKKSLFRKAVKSVTAISKFLTKAPSVPSNLDMDIQADAGQQQTGGTIENDWNEEGFSSMMSSHVLTSTVLTPTPSPTVYAARLERVQSHHLELQEKAKQKAENDLQFLEEKRRKGKHEQNKKAAKAGDYMKAWEEKNDDYSKRREKSNVKSDKDLFQRLANAAQQEELQRSQREQAFREMAENSALKREITKDAGNQRLWNTTEAFKDKFDARDRTCFQFRDLRIEAVGKRTADAGLEERVKAMCAKKSASEQAFKKSTQQYIERKQKRHETAKFFTGKAANPEKAFARFRLTKELAPARREKPPPELTLLSGFEMPDESTLGARHEFADIESPDEGSPQADRMRRTVSRRSSRLDASPQHDSSPEPSPKSALGSEEAGTAKARRRSSFGRIMRTGTMSSSSPTGAERDQSRRPSICSIHSGVNDDFAMSPMEAQEHESQFLEEMQSRAQGWLKTSKDE